MQDSESGEQRTLEARELFVFIGATPFTDWLVGTLALDSGDYVLTGSDAARSANGQFDELGRAPLMLETTEPGVLAVGDVRSGSSKRVASAVGEGSMAVRLINLDPPLGQQLLHVTVGQPVAQVPTHRQHDDLTREAKPREAGHRRRYSTMATTHQLSLPEHVIG